jgi:hypothetical protein
MSLQDLLAVEAGPGHTTSSVWQRLAQGVDDAAEQLIRGNRDLAEAWPQGSGPEAAAQRGDVLRASVSNTYNRPSSSPRIGETIAPASLPCAPYRS